jgi:FkbM family methyltransferase
MLDFALAQVAVRLVPGDVCVPFPNDKKLLIPPKMKGAAHFVCPGLCEFEEMCFVMHFLRPDDLFIDVGANIGAYTVLASGVAKAATIAFEPSPATYRYLVQNINLNQLDRAKSLNLALGSEEGVIQLTEGLGTENYVRPAGDPSKGVEVQVALLDKIVAHLEPCLMKVDVEGFETKVLAGATQTLQKHSLRAMIVERTGNGLRYGFDESLLHRNIQNAGFIPSAYSPPKRQLRRIPGDASGNIIYVRDFDRAEARLREAKAFEFGGLTI